MAKAQYEIGDLYYYGDGVAKDYYEAFKWYKLAADQDFPRAMKKLGELYQKGLGVSQDTEEAEQLFKLATDRRAELKQSYFDRRYKYGIEEVKKMEEELKNISFNSGKNLADAQFQLGLIHYEGQSVPQDDKEALKWKEFII